MDFRHINVCNTNVGITILKYKFFTKENDTISSHNIFLAANIPSNLKLLCKIHEYKRVDLMQGGGIFSRYYIPDTWVGTYEGTLFSCADNWEFRGCKKSQFAPFKQKPLLLKKGHATSFFGGFVICLLVVWRELTGLEPSQESSNLIISICGSTCGSEST